MTIKEAILSYPGLSEIPDDYIEKVLIDRALDGTVDYTLSLGNTVGLCVADCLVAMITSPDFSESKLSMKYPRGYLRSMAISLYEENGESSKASKLKVGKGNAKTTWW